MTKIVDADKSEDDVQFSKDQKTIQQFFMNHGNLLVKKSRKKENTSLQSKEKTRSFISQLSKNEKVRKRTEKRC